MRYCLFVSLVAVFLCPFSLTAEEITHREFLETVKALRPTGKELWRTVPWRTSLIDAQNDAVEQGKPIFIWAMDGHPLGCT